MLTFSDLISKYPGSRICVIGGAPVTLAQLQGTKADVFISANEHGAKILPVDYVVAMDDLHSTQGGSMRARIRKHTDAPVISPHADADIQLTSWPTAPHRLYSGLVGIWAAWAMGAQVVIVAGMNGYDGADGFMGKAAELSGFVKCDVRVLGGGPLTNIWPQYKPREKFDKYEPHSTLAGLKGMDGRILVRALKNTQVAFIDRKAGDEFSAMRHEVSDLIHHRVIEELGAA